MIPRECVVALRRRPITQASVDAPVVVVVDIVNNRYLGVREGSKLMASRHSSSRMARNASIWAFLFGVRSGMCSHSSSFLSHAVNQALLVNCGLFLMSDSHTWVTATTSRLQLVRRSVGRRRPRWRSRIPIPLQRRYTRFLLITSQCSRRNQ